MTTTTATKTSVRSFDCPDCARAEARRQRHIQDGYSRGTETRTTCRFCGMTGTVTVDPKAIFDAVLVSRGAAKGTFRRSAPAEPGDKGAVYGAKWVWREIRFATMLDGRLPVMSSEYIGIGWVLSDLDREVQAYLQDVADVIGLHLFGAARMARAAARWGQVLGFDGADELADRVEAAVGLPMGDGYDVGGPNESPEAFLEAFTDLDGNTDFEAMMEAAANA